MGDYHDPLSARALAAGLIVGLAVTITGGLILHYLTRQATAPVEKGPAGTSSATATTPIANGNSGETPGTSSTTTVTLTSGTRDASTSSAEVGSTSTGTTGTTATSGNQNAWERLNRPLILGAKTRPPDFEQTLPPDGVTSAIDVHSHAGRIWVFDLTGPAEAFWFWGYTSADMVAVPCVDKDGWQNCTPTTTLENPPKMVRIHNLDRTKSLAIKIWFAPYADNGQ